MEESRSTWQMWHVRAEAQRQVRTVDVPADRAATLVDLLIDGVLDRRSVALTARDYIEDPETQRRVDGSSVYTVAGEDLYTSQRILDAERRLHHLLTAACGRDLRTAGDMAAVLYWRLPALTPTNPGPLPWIPGVPEALHSNPVWRAYLAKRSQLVADLADQVQDHACQSDAPPVWASPGCHPSTALIGEIAVWRAANGINPQDPQATGGTHLETLPALWKQRLDRHIAHSTDSSDNARADEPLAAHTALRRWRDDRQCPYQTPGQRSNGPVAPSR
jgi:hypothetical protein